MVKQVVNIGLVLIKPEQTEEVSGIKSRPLKPLTVGRFHLQTTN